MVPGQQKGAFWRGSYLRKIVNSRAPIGFFTPSKTTRDEVTGTRRDVALDPVALMACCNRRRGLLAARSGVASSPPLRAVRNAMRKASSLVAGIAKCACGSSVVRVSRG